MEKQKYYDLEKNEFYTKEARQYYANKIGIEKVKNHEGWEGYEFVIYWLLGVMTRLGAVISIEKAQDFKKMYLDESFHLSKEEIDDIDILNL